MVVGLVMLLVLGFAGRLLWQWVTSDNDADRPPSLPEQAEQIPAVESIEVDSSPIPGSGANVRNTSSEVLLGPQALEDPARTAADLAGVSWGWSNSSWTLAETGSTADVSYRGTDEPAPYAWWLEAASLVEQTDAAGQLACSIRLGYLDCTVTGVSDPAPVIAALSAINGAEVAAWLEESQPDPDQPRGFRLLVGDREFTDPTGVGR